MNYSKGPWNADNKMRILPTDNSIDIFTNSKLLCRVFGKNDNLLWGNARLIASAPDMYEKLKLMTALVRLKYGNLDKDIYKEILEAEKLINQIEERI